MLRQADLPEDLRALTSQASGAPLLNRATESAYPTGSTFKPITALAALESGVITPTQTIIDDRPRASIGDAEVPERQGRELRRRSTCRDALKVSSDIFFYKLGAQANGKGHDHPALGAASSASAARPGSTCRARAPGLVPDSAWRNDGYDEVPRLHEEGARAAAARRRALYACGGIERPWTTGDNVNLAVGQGDLQATPLQLAVAYSALANGGKIVTPHLGKAIEDGNGVAARRSSAAKPRAQGRDRRRATARSILDGPAPAPPPSRAARRPTSSRAGRSATRSTARPAPPSAAPTPTRPGTRASCTDPAQADRRRR